MFSAFHNSAQIQKKGYHISDQLSKQSRDIHERNKCILYEKEGFIVERQTSTIHGGGTGVILTKGQAAKNTIVAMYPGK